MGPDENISLPNAADLVELRLRVERLERELAALHQYVVPRAAAPSAVPSPMPVAEPSPSEPSPLVTLEKITVAAPPPPIAPPHAVPRPKVSLENRLGSQIFNRIGIIAILCGSAWGLKLAIDNQLIGPLGRILIGLIAGAGIVVWSERFRRQGVKAFSFSLKAIGSGVLYLSLWAAFQLYHLLPAPVALGAMLLVTAWNAFMAWSQDAELLAAYALIGGFITPVLLSTGGNHEVFLFTYLLAINLATALLIRLKSWPRLVLGTFPATAIYFLGWYIGDNTPSALTITAFFLTLFWLTFVSISLGSSNKPISTRFGSSLTRIFLPLANAVFVSLGFYFLLQDSGHHAALPWLTLLLAAAYLGIMRLPQGRTVSALHLSLAVVFLTIAVPLKASGHGITVAWLVEGVALYWVATRLFISEPSTELCDDVVLRWLSWTALLLGFAAIFATPYWFDASIRHGFFNRDFATALLGISAFSGVAWLTLRISNAAQRSTSAVIISLIAVAGIALLLSLREIAATVDAASARTAFLNADFATALVGIAVLAAVASASLRIPLTGEHKQTLQILAAASIITLNLVAIASGVREVSALWNSSVASMTTGLKQALAVSAFLMLYSAMLLAAGFWKRTAFIRWQGLALLVFTIAKTFLYDMSSLSQGYRVVSFLGLGVLLMGVSFAYQKDWLNLREPTPPTTPATEEQL